MPAAKSVFRDEAFALRGQREPIDGLLRVTAPHEWAILLGLVLAMAAVGAWGVFGSVERGLRVDCVLIVPGERHAETFGVDAQESAANGVEAVALLGVGDARQVESGMQARILTSDLNLEGSEVLDAEVRSVSQQSVDLRERLDDSAPWPVTRGHVVRLALRSQPAAITSDGDACSAQIVLERHAPALWLTSADRR